jgi:2-polyprenyl-3-methyl-5-hydroxy-6-metoxy-1,4-benzoquinol methylase
VASGTGKISILAARCGADVTGADPAPALVERARELAEQAGVDGGISQPRLYLLTIGRRK